MSDLGDGLPSMDTAMHVGQIILFVLCVYAAAIWVALVYWTFRDIRQRTRDSVLQLFAVVLAAVPFLGHWIYLILRPRYTLTELYERSLEEEALLQDLEDQKACPTCKRRVKDDYLICPFCRVQLKELCRSCSKPMNYAWIACPFCGYEKPRQESYPQQQRRPAAQPRPPVQTQAPRQRPAPPAPAPVATTETAAASANGGVGAWPAEPAAATRSPRTTDIFAGHRHPTGGDDGAVIDATADPA